MDITPTFRGLCKAQKSLEKTWSDSSGSRGIRLANSATVKPAPSDFQTNALKTLGFITEVRDCVLKNKKEYLDSENPLSVDRRDEIELVTLHQLQSCSELLNSLYQDVHHTRTQIKSHRNRVIEIIKAYMSVVSRLFADQQAIRVKRTLDHAKLSKLESLKSPKRKSKDTDSHDPKKQNKGSAVHGANNPVILEQESKMMVSSPQEAYSLEEMQMFERENAGLYQELSGMEDDVKKIENQLTEISKLQQVFTENVLIQEHQIDDVAATAVGATENIKAGNIDIREAIQKTASFRAWILFVVLVLSFTLLFLDWYNE